MTLMACSAIIGTRDLEFVADAENGSSSGNPGPDGGVGGDGSADLDGGGDAATCMADLQTDPKHCGACFHDCFGGTCNAGKCDAIEIGSVAGAPLRSISASADHVFVTGIISLVTQKGGVWRIPKSGGNAEEYAPLRYAQMSAVLGNTLYFVVNDEPEGSGADLHGGLWSCPVAGPAPCTPTLIAAAKTPTGITIDGNRILYGDDDAAKGLMAYTPPAAPAVFRPGFGFMDAIFVDNASFFYGVSFFTGTERAVLFDVSPDGGTTELYRFERANAGEGNLTGNASALYFTAYDYGTSATATSAGVVRRVVRPGASGVPCDYGGTSNKRPYGIAIDAARVYWTNQGEGTARPWTGGSLNSCDLAGCCTTPTVLWTGDGEPSGIAMDETSLYFVSNATGSVRRIAKPL